MECSLDELPSNIIRQQLELDKVERKIEDVKLKQRQVLQHYNVNMNDLDEYRRNKSLVETIKWQQNKLEKAEILIDTLEKELLNEQMKNFRFEYSRLISEYELNEANKLMGRHIEPSELREIADDIYHNPSKYTDIITEIRERRRISSLNMDK